MFRIAIVCFLSINLLGSLGCGRARDDSPASVKDDFDDIDKEYQREAREVARLEGLEKKRFAAEERGQREAERAEEERENRRESAEQKRRAALCPELLGDLGVHLKVTPSASVMRLLGDNYSVELRGGPKPIDLDRLGQAIAAKKSLEVLSILQKTRVTEYPDEVTLDGIRREFLGHEFVVFVKTPIDLGRTHLITLSESKPKSDDLGMDITSPDYVYVNGKAVRYPGGGCNPSYLRWERHPEGSGWYFSWCPVDGEVIIAPAFPKDSLNPFPGDRSLSVLAKIEEAAIGLGKNTGPVLWKQVDYRGVRSSSDVPDGVVPGRLGAVGLGPTLQKKFKLGEVTPQQISDALDKACLERFLARRKAALAM